MDNQILPALMIRRDGPVMTVTLNRPEKMNAINAEMFFALAGAAEEAAHDSSVRVVIFEGAGKSFCAGGDIGGMRQQERSAGNAAGSAQAFRHIQGVFELIEAIPCATIAAVKGHALGAGLQLALMCDFRIAAQGATLGLPDVKNGIIPGLGATMRLPKLIGLARAKELIMTGDSIGARRAMEIGLVNHVVPEASLKDAVEELVRKLLQRAPLAMTAAKHLLNSEAGWDDIASTQVRLMGSQDAKEGSLAFFERRSPHFKGR